MDEKRFISSKKTIPRYIIGVSNIVHSIRHKLRISCDEYVFLDYVKTYQEANPGKKMTYSKFYIATGFSKVDIINTWEMLKAKKLVSKDQETGLVIISHEWMKHFSTVEDFEEVWKVYGIVQQGERTINVGEKGNKQKAKDAFLKAIKIVDVPTLVKAAKLYSEHCYKTETYIKNCSSWLNPKYRYWDDALKLETKQDEQIVTINNFMHGAKT